MHPLHRSYAPAQIRVTMDMVQRMLHGLRCTICPGERRTVAYLQVILILILSILYLRRGIGSVAFHLRGYLPCHEDITAAFGCVRGQQTSTSQGCWVEPAALSS